MKKADHEPGIAPKLRFPDFRNAGEWEYRALGEFVKLIDERVGQRSYMPMSITSGTGLVSQSEKFGRSIAGQQLKIYLVIRKGDFAYNKSATKDYPQGFAVMFEGDEPGCVPGSVFTCFSVTDGSISKPYINYLLQGNLHGRWLTRFLTTGARAHGSLNIDDKDLLALPVPLPTRAIASAEQRKIVECLSSIDDLIVAQADKLKSLRDHKTGLMQQLFPEVGATIPRLRFSEFHEAAEWDERTLGDICDVMQGYGFPEAMQGRATGDYAFCKVSDISRAVNDNGGILGDAANYIDRADLKKIRAKLVPAGSTVFAKIGEALRLNRRAIAKFDCIIDNNAAGLKAKSGILDDYFLYNLSKTIDMNNYCAGAVPSVNKSTLEGIIVRVPRLPEQKKIAESLLSINDLIAAQADKLRGLRVHKTGLMQQLFPSPHEASR